MVEREGELGGMHLARSGKVGFGDIELQRSEMNDSILAGPHAHTHTIQNIHTRPRVNRESMKGKQYHAAESE